MSRLTLVVVLACVGLVAAQTPVSQLGSIDIDAALHDSAKLEELIKCLLDDSEDSCTADFKIVRHLAEETAKNNCAGCTEPQKEDILKFMVYVSNEKPEYVPKLSSKYDPTGEFRAKHGDEYRAKGVKF
ncbi:ejaculatory bulb-specific protein 3-like [Schistocerca gregaria]|uniref:ejaculatory bulb-specific protein 3-like n=1 Tax=Schistocerca gregaria TaxID=7010 RepID=UPI00211EB762|nr:ejaculatory bulb-specific protein 3-like [Schistocerca gregaria]XP_049832041.1 ejaculatory bulb-specific protein 3-like [Schistocerca gregaria]